jgi:hypothetical protein
MAYCSTVQRLDMRLATTYTVFFCVSVAVCSSNTQHHTASHSTALNMNMP